MAYNKRTARRAPWPSTTTTTTPLLHNPHTSFHLESETKRFHQWDKLSMKPNKFFDHDICSTLEITDKLQTGAHKMGWPGMLHWRVPTFQTLTLEFLATLHFTDSHNVMHFRLCNRRFKIEMPDLTAIFGFTFQESHHQENDKKSHVMWRELTGEATFRDNNWASRIRDEEIDVVYLHRVLAGSLFGRATTFERVNAKELRILYAYKTGVRAPWESEIWDHLKELSKKKVPSGRVMCGALVTQIAISMPLNVESKIWRLEAGMDSRSMEGEFYETVTDKHMRRLLDLLVKKGKRKPKEQKRAQANFEREDEDEEELGEEEGEPSGPRQKRASLQVNLDVLTEDFYEFKESVNSRLDKFQDSLNDLQDIILDKFGCSTDTEASL